MSTGSVLAYEHEDGEIYGTYVRFDGYPSYAIPAIQSRIDQEGIDGVKAWIDKGVEGGGFSSYDCETTYEDRPYKCQAGVHEQEYGYLLTEDGVRLWAGYNIYDGKLCDLTDDLKYIIDNGLVEEYLPCID